MAIQPGVGYTFTSSSQGENFNVIDPFRQEPIILDPFVCSPFLVHDVVENTGGGGTYVTYEICPGVINNLTPGVFDTTSESWQLMDALPETAKLILDFNGTSQSIIYLRVGPDGTTGVFPKAAPGGSSGDPYPRIYSTGSTFPSDSNTLAYVKLAKVVALGSQNYRVDQYVTGSLWGDRIQIGAGSTMTSYYYYARI